MARLSQATGLGLCDILTSLMLIVTPAYPSPSGERHLPDPPGSRLNLATSGHDIFALFHHSLLGISA
ncbi:hypothetical protein OPQ81_010385 [Rhizoctonia solani]|nr:hypothetical protein OPQ81_010385 [Rhizoctonia solani]